ncbi:hypothetical protein BCR36DRAFT_579404 [Piromyces finnis]|uniref:VWFA domain-containing protein n=1 Tax=Piromyces finnis TaxID=1754191 RepID=A0A1Y1VMW1_9FUNG|nr:hypothetical protein BCR36DRAFT_579404 [Piromyces finnis]|eukprot:ORX59952.1 hypothetical protein BCR36DRAFT_579404 [Piromyces finnis]
MVSLKAYKSNNGYIGKINISELETTMKQKADVKFFVILDRSGSMRHSVRKFVNLILPKILIKLNMTEVDIDLITFDDYSEIYTGNMTYFKNLDIDCRGGTHMACAIEDLKVLLNKLIIQNKKQNIRILTLSDGDLFDQSETLNLASSLYLDIKDNFIINSQAIRFFTSSCEPDTRGLSSMLQFNTLSNPYLIDIDSADGVERIAESIAALYRHDGMNYKITLQSSEKILKENPWNLPDDTIDLFEEDNFIWMDKLPEQIYIQTEVDGLSSLCNIPVEICEELTLNNYKRILDKKIDFFMRKLKVLKIINTQTALEEMKLIAKYFEEFEQYLINNSMQGDSNDYILIKDRIHYLKRRIRKQEFSIFGMMKEIQNNDKVSQLNSKQLADFLRNVEVNKDGKSLSRRGMNEGIDFDEEARKEVLAMAEHLDEIKDIDDSEHSVSFYSTYTTLEGIKSVCELADDKDALEAFTAIDIIKLLNIVGIGCDGFIGNYTDPMIYRLNDIYLGCYISLSDVLTASEFSNGENNLVDFNTRKIITNVIPVFDDQRIHQFLLKYAPKLLEYTASIGMRRVLVEVPYTYEFSIESGILKICQMFSENHRSEAVINLFSQLIENYQVASKGHYNYVNNLINKQIEGYQSDEEQSKYYIYLDDNSVECMTNVFINIIKNNQMEILPKILRHLFCHEIHRVVNKMIKKNQDIQNYAHITLKSLLGIDYEKNGTPLPKMFDQNNIPEFFDEYTVNYDIVNEIFSYAKNVMMIPFIPYYIQAILQEDKIEGINKISECNEENVKSLLDIHYNFEEFKVFSIVQALLCIKNESRMDTSNQRMIIIDTENYEESNEMVKKYIRTRYRMDYESRLNEQLKKEASILEDELVIKMLTSESLEEFKEGFKNGISRGNSTVKIENIYSAGFLKLINELNSNYKTENYPLLFDKTSIILLGRDEDDQVVWNNGNVCRKSNKILKNILKESDSERWEEVEKIYKKHNIHIYRSYGMNRHGHDNGKPSYWALGYKTLEDMFNSVPQEEIDKYKSIHTYCCGLNRY